MSSFKNVWIAMAVVTVIAVLGVFTPVGKEVVSKVEKLGGVTNYDEVDATAIKIGGTNGSRVGPVIAGTCTLLGANLPVSASSTAPFDCAVTGVVAGDQVFVSLATTSKTTNGEWIAASSNASSTSGFITINLTNYTSAAASPASSGNAGGNSFGSTTQYLILHPVTSVPGL